MIYPAGVEAPTANYGWPSIDVDPNKLHALCQSLMDAGVKYGLGAKADPLSLQAGGFQRIDCSGFVRWAFFHAAGITIPDGSAVQHQWFEIHGFKKSDYESGRLTDGYLRIAFLSPSDSSEHIGHVLFIFGGKCIESHGSTGPDDRRLWGDRPLWMGQMHLYIVNPPNSA